MAALHRSELHEKRAEMFTREPQNGYVATATYLAGDTGALRIAMPSFMPNTFVMNRLYW